MSHALPRSSLVPSFSPSVCARRAHSCVHNARGPACVRPVAATQPRTPRRYPGFDRSSRCDLLTPSSNGSARRVTRDCHMLKRGRYVSVANVSPPASHAATTMNIRDRDAARAGPLSAHGARREHPNPLGLVPFRPDAAEFVHAYRECWYPGCSGKCLVRIRIRRHCAIAVGVLVP